MPAIPGDRKAPGAACARETGGVGLLTRHFVGRAGELGSLERLLDELDRGCPGAVGRGRPCDTAEAGHRRHPAAEPAVRSFETAAACPGTAAPGDTCIAVVGGGPVGAELSGYIANFLFHYQFEADYPQLDPAAMRVTLLGLPCNCWHSAACGLS